jgi:hypothetical protein
MAWMADVFASFLATRTTKFSPTPNLRSVAHVNKCVFSHVIRIGRRGPIKRERLHYLWNTHVDKHQVHEYKHDRNSLLKHISNREVRRHFYALQISGGILQKKRIWKAQRVIHKSVKSPRSETGRLFEQCLLALRVHTGAEHGIIYKCSTMWYQRDNAKAYTRSYKHCKG